MSALTLRDGDDRDLDAVNRMMAAAFDPAFGEAWTPAQCVGVLDLPGIWLSVAERAGAPVGFALGRIVLDEAELLLLAVLPEARRCGVGAALLARTAAMARARGADRLHLEMRDGNPAAALYAGAGFRPVGRRGSYYRGADGSFYDAISLSRPLGGAETTALD